MRHPVGRVHHTLVLGVREWPRYFGAVPRTVCDEPVDHMSRARACCDGLRERAPDNASDLGSYSVEDGNGASAHDQPYRFAPRIRASAPCPSSSGSRSHPVRIAHDQLSPTAAAILRERARIARELHDTVSQTLYAITLSASRALRVMEHKEASRAQEFIGDVLHLATTAQSELRALLTDNYPVQRPPASLKAGLAELTAQVSARSNIEISLSVGQEPDAPQRSKEVLLIVCREALHNVVKHARATRVDILLKVTAHEVVLLIIDNGRGFSPITPRPGHFGLYSMRERATSIGGRFELTSTVGRGTRVGVSVPRATVRRKESRENHGNPRVVDR